MKTQEEIILNVLRQSNQWTEGYKLVKVNTPYGWLGSDATRACRRLAEKDLIEKKREGKYTLFKAKQPKKVIEYRVAGELVAQKTIW